MTTYHLVWEIDVDAESHREAAEKALGYMQQPTTATVFDVIEADSSDIVRVDLLEDESQ